MEAVITIDEIKKQEPGFCKFVAQGRTFNYKHDPEREAMDLAPFFSVGKRIAVDYREFTYAQGPAAGKTGRYINSVSAAGASAPNTFTAPPKRDIQTDGQRGRSKSTFDPHLSARQTAAHVAGVLTGLTHHENAAEDVVWSTFESYANNVAAWLNLDRKDPLAEAVQMAKDGGLVPYDIDPAYEQARADHDNPPDDDIPF